MLLRKKLFLAAVLLGFFVVGSMLPIGAPGAWAAGIVPCGDGSDAGNACTLCHLVLGVKNLIDWGFGIMTFIGIAAIVAMGILYIVSAGSEQLMETAKNGIKAALVGFGLMLGAWLIVNITMWLLVAGQLGGGDIAPRGLVQGAKWYEIKCNASSQAGTSVAPRPKPTTTGPLPAGCQNYTKTFEEAAASTGVDKCLLYAIAAAESGCNPNAMSPVGACGMMQFLPSTAGKSCEWLKAHPEESVTLAANYLKENVTTLGQYSTFDLGTNFTQSGSPVTLGGITYDAGNDDIIASYNAGPGTKDRQGRQGYGPFAVSTSCPGAPVWQCNGNGFAETRTYVTRVQNFQRQCN